MPAIFALHAITLQPDVFESFLDASGLARKISARTARAVCSSSTIRFAGCAGETSLASRSSLMIDQMPNWI